VELQTVQDTTAYAFSGESCKIFSGHLPCKSFQRVSVQEYPLREIKYGFGFVRESLVRHFQRVY
jgi:hypothetical protein